MCHLYRSMGRLRVPVFTRTKSERPAGGFLVLLRYNGSIGLFGLPSDNVTEPVHTTVV